MKKILSAFVVVLGLFMFVNQDAGLAMGKRPHKAYLDVKTISKEALSQKLQNGEPVQVVDDLDPEYYKLGVIKGSLKIPLSELDSRLGELDKSKEVVTYCASYQCGASGEAAHKLGGLGFNVRAYEGGIKEWKSAGLPVE